MDGAATATAEIGGKSARHPVERCKRDACPLEACEHALRICPQPRREQFEKALGFTHVVESMIALAYAPGREKLLHHPRRLTGGEGLAL